ncbi:MAG: endolytic transglycosylase MltG, partial [Clostridiales Family XIII bacterium]|nr:endolytic transglycosylase MltG [Clostridiales Family XIII bacterium]
MAGKYAQEPKRRISPVKVILLTLLVVVLLLGAAFGVVYAKYRATLQAVDPSDAGQVAVTVPSGASTETIAQRLSEVGLIESAFFFKLHSRLTGRDGLYKQGDYELAKTMTTDQIMQALMEGGQSQDVTRFTIPEGYNTVQIMHRLVDEGLVTEESFMEALRADRYDYPFLAGVPNDDTRLDGFLYPETYEIYVGADAGDIIDKMLAQFDKLFLPEYYEQAKALGYTVREIVTMGSLIERESKTAEERPVMAGVFYNRLNEDMKLESCASIQYIL